MADTFADQLTALRHEMQGLWFRAASFEREPQAGFDEAFSERWDAAVAHGIEMTQQLTATEYEVYVVRGDKGTTFSAADAESIYVRVQSGVLAAIRRHFEEGR